MCKNYASLYGVSQLDWCFILHEHLDINPDTFSSWSSSPKAQSVSTGVIRIKRDVSVKKFVQIEPSGIELLAAHIKFNSLSCSMKQRQSLPSEPQSSSLTNTRCPNEGMHVRILLSQIAQAGSYALSNDTNIPLHTVVAVPLATSSR